MAQQRQALAAAAPSQAPPLTYQQPLLSYSQVAAQQLPNPDAATANAGAPPAANSYSAVPDVGADFRPGGEGGASKRFRQM